MTENLTALVIEPNAKLIHPYDYLAAKLQMTKVDSIKDAHKQLAKTNFDCFILSTSFSPEKQLSLLNSFKYNFKQNIIPLLLVVDLTQPISTVSGTQWGDKVAILTHNASKKLTLITLDSLLSV